MTDFEKIVRIGLTRDSGNLFCKIKHTDGRLSITGVEGPKRNGDARGACGQIVMHDWDLAAYAPGWDADLVARFQDVWLIWHLNDMQAGNPVQMAHLRKLEAEGRDWRTDGAKGHYEWALAELDKAGLNPEGNRYGRKWHKVAVPADVLAFLQALPDTDITPAWVWP
jgi:hypothetical protein